MKKVLLFLFINVYILIIFVLISDIYIYCDYTAHGKNLFKDKYGYVTKPFKIFGFELKNFFDGNYKFRKGRRPDGLEYENKTPIIVMGCSFANGYSLRKEQTFSYKLAHILERPVYNRSIPGSSFQQMYYQTVDKGGEYFYKEVPPSDTVIYIMIPDQFRRMIRYVFFDYYLSSIFNPVYKLKNNEFVLNDYKNPFLNIVRSSYTVKIINYHYTNWYVEQKINADKLTDMMLLYFIKSRESMEKHWNRNINFIVLFYEYEDKRDEKVTKNLVDLSLKKLKNNGFIVLKTSELTYESLKQKKYIIQGDGHPTEAAWDLLTPLFVDYFKRKYIL